jgi:hypothetical protein
MPCAVCQMGPTASFWGFPAQAQSPMTQAPNPNPQHRASTPGEGTRILNPNPPPVPDVGIAQVPLMVQGQPSLKPIGYTLSYVACRTGHWVPIH